MKNAKTPKTHAAYWLPGVFFAKTPQRQPKTFPKIEVIKIQLRPYQEEIVNKIRAELLNGRRSIVAVLGCGGGKDWEDYING